MTNILLVIQTFFESLSGAEHDLHDQALLDQSASREKMMRAQMRQLERLRYGAAWRRQTSILLSSVVWFRERTSTHSNLRSTCRVHRTGGEGLRKREDCQGYRTVVRSVEGGNRAG